MTDPTISPHRATVRAVARDTLIAATMIAALGSVYLIAGSLLAAAMIAGGLAAVSAVALLGVALGRAAALGDEFLAASFRAPDSCGAVIDALGDEVDADVFALPARDARVIVGRWNGRPA
jgi:hypothetical protein